MLVTNDEDLSRNQLGNSVFSQTLCFLTNCQKLSLNAISEIKY